MNVEQVVTPPAAVLESLARSTQRRSEHLVAIEAIGSRIDRREPNLLSAFPVDTFSPLPRSRV